MVENSTSCTPMRTFSMSEVIRLMIRPCLMRVKNSTGMRWMWANTSFAQVVHDGLAQLHRVAHPQVQHRHLGQRQQQQHARPDGHPRACRATGSGRR